MKKKILNTIGGQINSPVYEIIDEGLCFTIRSIEYPNESVSMMKSVIPVLIEVLQKANNSK